MKEVRWSPEAADDLEQIVLHVQRDKPETARKIALDIYQSVGSLSRFPSCGRVGRIQARELVLAPPPWIAVYRVRNEVVEVVRIQHGAQKWL